MRKHRVQGGRDEVSLHVKDLSYVVKSKFNRFHKIYWHKTEEYFQLKNVIKNIIENRRIDRYVKDEV